MRIDIQDQFSILICGHDVMLLNTRRWVLEGAGYRVSTAMDGTEAQAVMERARIDLLLLCHTLSVDEQRGVFAVAARVYPEVKRLSFVTLAEDGRRETVDGVTVKSFAGAVGLLSSVRKLLHQNSGE